MAWWPSLAVAAALACAGCAPERGTAVLGYQAAHADEDASVDAAIEARQVGRKSLAARVLAAIALERVTGRKPDPGRFIDSN